MIQKVGIVGLGAIGALYANELQKALGGDDVCIVADDARVERYERDGIVINGVPVEFRYVHASQAKPVDLLIFATKYLGLADAAAMARGACGPDTIVMSFLNGVSSEGVLTDVLHPAHLLYTTVQGMDATKEGNRLTYSHTGSVAFNDKDGADQASVRAVAELLDRAQLAYSTPRDIEHQLWSKWMLNVGVNQVCAAFGLPYGGIQEPGEHRETMIAAMREAQQAARHEGIVLSDDELESWVALMDTLDPDGEPSMRQDTKAGRRTEVVLFSGKVRELGARQGIATPVNDRLWSMLAKDSDEITI